MKNILLFAILFFMPLNANAADPLKVKYAIYASGFEVVNIDGTYHKTDDNRYKMVMDLETAGLLGRLAPWSGLLQSEGLDKGVKSTPLSHSFANTWQGDTETSLFEFNNDGTLTSHKKIQEDGSVEDKMPKADVYDNGAMDMVSALYRTMNKPSCAGSELATDGKRKFNMVFRSKGTGMITPTKYTSFNGEVEICEVEIEPVAGKWRDKKRGWMSIQEQAKSNGQLPRIWFGKVRDDYPAIPVRFQINTDYGVMIMHLVESK